MSHKPTSREALSTAAVLIKSARHEIGNGRLTAADEALTQALRLLMTTEARDVGSIPPARDLDNPHELIADLQREVKRLESETSACGEGQDDIDGSDEDWVSRRPTSSDK